MSYLRYGSLLVFTGLILIHVVAAPYTKVEESFNIQAIHDIISYGVPLSNAHLKFKTLYDHMTFPGSVPRTFIGSLVVSFFAQPVATWQSLHGVKLQILVRCVLGLMNALALQTFLGAVRLRYGNRTAMWYLFLQCSQFHIFYYASRTLPNMFAFCLSTFALAAGLKPVPSPQSVRKGRLSVYLLTIAAVIFRSELALLLAAQSLNLLRKARGIAGRVAVIQRIIVPAFVAAFAVGLLLTVAIDTYFWQSKDYVWPEGAAFLFNIFPSKGHKGASAWGTSPWYWYTVSAIPRLTMSPGLLLIPYGVLYLPQRNDIIDQIFPALIYTAIYSFLPHKETRFLFPIVPQLTLAMALTASYVSVRRQQIAKLVTGALVLSTALTSFFSHVVLLPLSAQSYPGAEALTLLHQTHYQLGSDRPQLNVYLTNLALQTGITRFLEQPVYPHTNTSFGNEPPPSPTPVIMPGSPDGKFPALTYYPKSTGTPERTRLKFYERPLWTYHKTTSEEDGHLSSKQNENHIRSESLSASFWDQFDYMIVENATPFTGNKSSQEQSKWKLIGTTPSLSRNRPRIIRKSLNHDENNDNKLLVLNRDDENTTYQNTSIETSDGVYELVLRMYGRNIAWVYGAAHDIFVHGVGIGGISLTKGYWIEWQPLETRLYVFGRNGDSGAVESGNNDHRRRQGGGSGQEDGGSEEDGLVSRF